MLQKDRLHVEVNKRSIKSYVYIIVIHTKQATLERILSNRFTS